MTQNVLQFRVFISSPGDVGDERTLARQLLSAELPRAAALRGRVSFDPIAWDDPAAEVAMLANETPQASVNRSLPRPSDCDFIVVILWSRMGTPLPVTDGTSTSETYLSGTEWEYHDAVKAGKPVLVYRRTEKPRVRLDDPSIDALREQWNRVERFFAQLKNRDGSLGGGVNTYETPSEFKEKLRSHLEQLVLAHLDRHPITLRPPVERTLYKSPFPGLRAFTAGDAAIFFGRGAETDALVARVREFGFVAVIGGSGSGKSSLVGAGLIPRLAGHALPGTIWRLPSFDTSANEWRGLRFTPGEIDENPFTALAVKMSGVTGTSVRQLAARLASGHDVVGAYLSAGSSPTADRRIALIFIDQFEELFTVCNRAHVAPFADFLNACSRRTDVRVVATMRADFYQHAVDVPALAQLLQSGTFPLSPPRTTLLETILGPAEYAGIELEDGLASSILMDAGQEPGTLALLAYALDELYRLSPGGSVLRRKTYVDLGGVQGAIGRRADEAYATLTSQDQHAFNRVFGELVSVDENGTATRRRSRLAGFTSAARELVDAFARERLLTISGDNDPVVEVSHEALFYHWKRLASWIQREQDDLILLRQVRHAATFWNSRQRNPAYLWTGDRLKEALSMLARRQPLLNDAEQEFVRPEVERLTEIIGNPETTHFQRVELGDRLALIGDTRRGVGVKPDGTPDIVWCDVPESNGGFRIAQFPITYRQFRSFRTSDQFRKIDNCPAENVSFEEARMFCDWLSERVSRDVRLPTADEWETAARGGDPARHYPWGAVWNVELANTAESRLARTTAVGMYPLGAAPCGACDMSGNVWEWTGTAGPQNDDSIVCGGSWLTGSQLAAIGARRAERRIRKSNNIGFRPILIGLPPDNEKP